VKRASVWRRSALERTPRAQPGTAAAARDVPLTQRLVYGRRSGRACRGGHNAARRTT
jgi:hypothetical protein